MKIFIIDIHQQRAEITAKIAEDGSVIILMGVYVDTGEIVDSGDLDALEDDNQTALRALFFNLH